VATSTASATSDLDLFAPEVVADPFPILDELRELSSAVYMSEHDFWLLTRYDDVRAAAADWEAFTSAEGVALSPQFNESHKGSVLGSDPPQHDQLRAVLSDKLAPRGLSNVREEISAYAISLVDEMVAKGKFDGAVDVAWVFPINVVADLVGLPIEGRELMHPGADATFAGFGPFSPYLAEHFDQMITYQQWMGTMADRSKLTPGRWGATVMDAVDDGRLTQVGAIKTFSAYMTAGMDTTVNSIAALLRLFAERPDVWTKLRENPKLVGPVFEEILRLESPVTGFFRLTTREVNVGDVVIPKGARVMLHWAAANRDPRHYSDPTEFRIDRNPLDHLAFGYGVHACAGQGLARMEAITLLEAFIGRVETFALTAPAVRGRNPIVRSTDSVPLVVTAAK
jgi:cytochrome P450